MVQKDLNLFEVYRSSGGKGGSNKGLVILIATFVFVILSAYGGILFLKITMQQQVNSIKSELQKPQVIENNQKVANEVSKNDFLVKYNSAITLAKKSFDLSRVIDKEIVTKITTSMPADVVASQISINAQSMSITCKCSDRLSPAAFTQSLRTKNIFKSISYDGYTTGENGQLSFTVNCNFMEVVAK